MPQDTIVQLKDVWQELAKQIPVAVVFAILFSVCFWYFSKLHKAELNRFRQAERDKIEDLRRNHHELVAMKEERIEELKSQLQSERSRNTKLHKTIEALRQSGGNL